MMSDPIADFLTRIRNAIKASHKIVDIPSSNIKKELCKVLYENGYILNYKTLEDNKQGIIRIALKYAQYNKSSVIQCIERVSTPGLRKYVKATKMPRVLNGMGIAILSTSKGLMTDKQAKLNNTGGEILCYVY
ncbi:MAG: 30S ribosomal protein S8 [Chitinophagaceae bacterium]|nr:30S ribosomal protein S8 [Chitinophagaceae bacterium]